MTAVNFALTLDPPFDFATENGYRRTQRSADFRVLPGAQGDKSGQAPTTWFEPISGVLMLRPNFLNDSYAGSMRPGSDFTTTATQGTWWQQVSRGGEDGGIAATQMFASLRPTGVDPTGITLTDIAAALTSIAASPTLQDTLVWAAQSNFQIPKDGSFTIHYDSMNDEVIRHNNWFVVAWDVVAVHFSMDGTCRVYQYNDSSQQDYTLVDQFSISDAGEMMNQHVQISFIPIPTAGLLVYHSYHERAMLNLFGSAQSNAGRGHLVPWAPKTDGSGNAYMFNASAWNLAVNPYFRHVWGYQDVQFLTAGSFIDDAFDPGYVPSVGPDALVPFVVQNGIGPIACNLYNPDGVTAWTPGSSQQGRMQMNLNGDAIHTPFVLGYGVSIPPVFQTRNPGAVTIYNQAGSGTGDRLLRLNGSDDSAGRFDGEVEMQLHSSQALAIAFRGDATWNLYADGQFYAGGLTVKDSWEVEPMEGPPGYYKATVKLADMHARLKEGHFFIENAMDGAYIGQVFNSILACCGFRPITAFPAGISANSGPQLPISADGRSWKWQFNEADDADMLFDIFLFMMKAQDTEYLAYFDWENTGLWQIYLKPGSMGSSWDVWTLSQYSADADLGSQVWWYGPGTKFEPQPPEGNVFMAEGVLDPGPHGKRISAGPPSINYDSLNNPSSPDYLGRRVVVKYPVDNVEDVPTLAKLQRAIFDAASRGRKKGNIHIESLNMALAPNVEVIILDGFGNVLQDCWIKRRHFVVTDPYDATMELEVDTVWEGEIPR